MMKKTVCLLTALVLCLTVTLISASAESSVKEQAIALLEAEDYSAAVLLLQEGAEQGDAEAQYLLANCYVNGQGVEQDQEKIFEYYRLAAEQELPTAMFALGICCQNGIGTEKDPETAAEWYQKALDAGYEPDEEDQMYLKEVFGEDGLTSE